MSIKKLPLLGVMLGSVSLSGCDLDIPNLNSPGQDQLETNPTVTTVNSAATGLLIGNRGAKGTTTGYVNLLGILGREAYDFDVSDNRFTTEMLQGPLINNDAFGGGFWAGPYANIRLANLILHGVDKVTDYSDRDKQAIRGFAHTVQALELMVVIFTHDVTGAVIDTDRPVGDLAPFVSKDAVYVEIGRLLDQAQTELADAVKADAAAGGDAPFSFPLSPGFSGFTTPKGFLRFNRAIRARIAVHHKDYQVALDALAASFLADTAPINFNTGVFYSYSVAVGDATNGLNNRSIYAHPALATDAQKQADGKLDARYLAKITDNIDPDTGMVRAVPGPTKSGVQSSIKFKMYTSTTSIPVIRNEELILLKAEALYFTGQKAAAIDELNLVRANSGRVVPPLGNITDDAAFINALLYERRYSLLFEGGHRWIDLRRFGIPLPLDVTADSDSALKHVRNVHYPVPLAECDARPGEPACSISSQQSTP